MILIVESGATRSRWVVINGADPIYSCELNGINVTANAASLNEVRSFFEKWSGRILKVYFYGAGISSDITIQKIQNAFRPYTPDAIVEVRSDLTASARATSPGHTSIICILGTGSNCGVFDGARITHTNISPGYLIGDPGSACHMGQLILKDWFFNRMQKEDVALLENYLNMKPRAFRDRLYEADKPNVMIASVTKFLSGSSAQFRNRIVDDALEKFFKFNLEALPETKKYKLNFTGSVAYAFRENILKHTTEKGYIMGKVIADPMEELINYHIQNSHE